MNNMKVDLAVLGGGPGGYVASIRASKLGMKVAVIERDHLGGVCLNCGCIPTKALYHTVSILDKINKAKDFGIEISKPKLNFKKVMSRKDRIVEMLRKALQSHFEKNRIELIKGNGRIAAVNKIAVMTPEGGEIEIEANNIIIATGSSPRDINPFNFSEEGILDNTGILSIGKLPESLVIIGGGVVGSEFANIFSSLGTKVILIEMLPRILSTEDEDVSKVIHDVFIQKKVNIFTNTEVEKVKKGERGFICITSNGNRINTDKVLVAAGRKPNTAGIGIKEAGIEMDRKGYIKVDSYLRTNIRSIYAVGDVIGGLKLAHVASEEGKIAAENIAGKTREMDYNIIPWAVFTSPEIGAVGLNEIQARENGIKVCTGLFPFNSSGRAIITGDTKGFIKVVTNSETGEILGSQIVGPRASDLVHEIAVAMKGEILVDDLVSTVHSHPTFSEAVLEAAEDCFKIATHK